MDIIDKENIENLITDIINELEEQCPEVLRDINHLFEELQNEIEHIEVT